MFSTLRLSEILSFYKLPNIHFLSTCCKSS